MEIYVVAFGLDYEGLFEAEAVFSSRELADAYIKAKAPRWLPGHCCVTKLTLDKPDTKK